ncbi:hypothetical protein BH23ACT12_BH23ACT12_15900 [soil metagenome]
MPGVPLVPRIGPQGERGAGEEALQLAPPAPAKVFVPKGRPPNEVAAWWSDLTEAEKARLNDRHFREIGRLEGLPAVVRDKANRRALNDQVDELFAQRREALRELRRAEDDTEVITGSRGTRTRGKR